MKIPEHTAIIMDGNGRWARSRNRPRYYGHRQGVKALEKVVRAAADIGGKYLTVFAFSTENWKRPSSEVDFLFELLQSTVKNELNRLQKKENIQIKVMGRRRELPRDVRQDIDRIENVSSDNSGLKLFVALNYGGRAEIIDAVRKIASRSDKDLENLDEESFRKHLYIPELPDVDLLIRTGGEKRISNFMLWRLSYSELYFTSTLWPDFSGDDLKKAYSDYSRRCRRFGALSGE